MRLNNILMALLCLFVSIAPVSAAEVSQPAFVTVADTIGISVNWNGGNGDINLGTFAAASTLLTFMGNETVTDQSNIPIDLSTKFSGLFKNGTNTIFGALNAANYGTGNLNNAISLTTDYQVVLHNWDLSVAGANATVPVDYTFNIPIGTAPGLYSTTIFHQAEASAV